MSWRKKCRGWAEAGEPFQVRDLEAHHFVFCQEICAKYDYFYKYRCVGRTESTATFHAIDV